MESDMTPATLPPRSSTAHLSTTASFPRAPVVARRARGPILRIIDLEGNQAVDCILYNANDPAERVQLRRHDGRPEQYIPGRRHEAPEQRRQCDDDHRLRHLRPPRHHRRRVQLRIQHASLRPSHQTPACVRRELSRRPGPPRAGQARHGQQHQLVHERARRSRRALGIVDGISAPGKYLDLHAEMDTLVVISNCPQINNPCNAFNPTPVRVVVSE